MQRIFHVRSTDIAPIRLSLENAKIGGHAGRAVGGKRGFVKPVKSPRLATCAHLGYELMG